MSGCYCAAAERLTAVEKGLENQEEDYEKQERKNIGSDSILSGGALYLQMSGFGDFPDISESGDPCCG